MERHGTTVLFVPDLFGEEWECDEWMCGCTVHQYRLQRSATVWNIAVIAFTSRILPVVVQPKGLANCLGFARSISREWGLVKREQGLVQVNFTKKSYGSWSVDVLCVTKYNDRRTALHGERYTKCWQGSVLTLGHTLGLRMLFLVLLLFLDGLQRRWAWIPFIGTQRVRPVCCWLAALRLISGASILRPPYCIHWRVNGPHCRDGHFGLEGHLSSPPSRRRRSIVSGRHGRNSNTKHCQICRECSRCLCHRSAVKVARSGKRG